jgi:hypothetical protein
MTFSGYDSPYLNAAQFRLRFNFHALGCGRNGNAPEA